MIREDWRRRIFVDLLVWVLAALACWAWRMVADKSGIAAYWSLFGVLAVLWIFIGWIVQLYRSYKDTWFWQSILSLAADSIILVFLCRWALPQLPWGLSYRVAEWTILMVAVLETVVVVIEHYWKYATNMTVPPMQDRKSTRLNSSHTS